MNHSQIGGANGYVENDDQGFASSNHTGTNFFINQKLNLVSFCMFVCLFDLIIYVPPIIIQL